MGLVVTGRLVLVFNVMNLVFEKKYYWYLVLRTVYLVLGIVKICRLQFVTEKVCGHRSGGLGI